MVMVVAFSRRSRRRRRWRRRWRRMERGVFVKWHQRKAPGNHSQSFGDSLFSTSDLQCKHVIPCFMLILSRMTLEKAMNE